MKLEQTKKGNWRCWLTESEQQELLDVYDDESDVVKRIALRLMLECGLRSDEVPRVESGHIEPSEKADFKRLKVYIAKNDYRETIIPDDLAEQIKTVASFMEDGRVVQNSKRTVRYWVLQAAEELADDSNDNDDWYKVSAHDLRRTWATNLVQSGVPSDLVMDWGGWQDHSTFRQHYWKVDDEAIQEHLDRIDF
jgi:integrase